MSEHENQAHARGYAPLQIGNYEWEPPELFTGGWLETCLDESLKHEPADFWDVVVAFEGLTAPYEDAVAIARCIRPLLFADERDRDEAEQMERYRAARGRLMQRQPTRVISLQDERIPVLSREGLIGRHVMRERARSWAADMAAFLDMTVGCARRYIRTRDPLLARLLDLPVNERPLAPGDKRKRQ